MVPHIEKIELFHAYNSWNAVSNIGFVTIQWIHVYKNSNASSSSSLSLKRSSERLPRSTKGFLQKRIQRFHAYKGWAATVVPRQ